MSYPHFLWIDVLIRQTGNAVRFFVDEMSDRTMSDRKNGAVIHKKCG